MHTKAAVGWFALLQARCSILRDLFLGCFLAPLPARARGRQPCNLRPLARISCTCNHCSVKTTQTSTIIPRQCTRVKWLCFWSPGCKPLPSPLPITYSCALAPPPPHLLTVAVTETGQRWRERTMNGRILLEADDESSAVGDRFHCRRRHHSVEHAAADTRE